MRVCGPCSACCGVIAVHAIQKPQWEECPHQSGGCAIYHRQPKPCQKYRCAWLSGELAEEERPDLIGVIVDDGLSPLFKPLWGDRALCVRETSTGSSKSPLVTGLIERLVNEDRAIFIKAFGGGVDFRCNDRELQERFEEMAEVFAP